MKLQDIKGEYDVIISLGSWCGPSLNLRRHNLRRFSFPLDWVVSNSLSDVNKLLKNGFDGFMDIRQMQRIDGVAAYLDDGDAVFADEGRKKQNAHFIQDSTYNIISVHDFPIIEEQDWKQRYPSYKEKLNYRIRKFIDILANSQSVLFIRWGAVIIPEALELRSTLAGMTPGKCNILFLDPIADIPSVKEIDWGIDGICTVQVPSQSPNDDSMWNHVYDGLAITDYWKN